MGWVLDLVVLTSFYENGLTTNRICLAYVLVYLFLSVGPDLTNNFRRIRVYSLRQYERCFGRPMLKATQVFERSVRVRL